MVNEAPKAHCVECSGISNNHRFFTAPHETDVVDLVGGSESDLSSHSIGISSNNGLDGGEIIHEFDTINHATSNQNSLEKLTQAIQVNLQIVDTTRNDQLRTNFRQNISNDGVNNNDKILPEVENVQLLNVPYEERRQSCKTAAAPWHRPSIYYFNPFGGAFHGNLTRSSVKRQLSLDGHFLVRKRMEDGDDEFVLSVKLVNNSSTLFQSCLNLSFLIWKTFCMHRFNGRVKNFLVCTFLLWFAFEFIIINVHSR